MILSEGDGHPPWLNTLVPVPQIGKAEDAFCPA